MAKSAMKPMTKSEIYKAIAEKAGLTHKQVRSVFEGLTGIISKSLSGKGPGIFTISGLVKLKVVQEGATKAREGFNPFTGAKMIFKAKPARKVVTVQVLKGVKAMACGGTHSSGGGTND